MHGDVVRAGQVPVGGGQPQHVAAGRGERGGGVGGGRGGEGDGAGTGPLRPRGHDRRTGRQAIVGDRAVEGRRRREGDRGVRPGVDRGRGVHGRRVGDEVVDEGLRLGQLRLRRGQVRRVSVEGG